jgi:hypothetical protein
MILSQELWMELRAFKALAEAGATWAEIARETGYDWRTVKRYLGCRRVGRAAGAGQAGTRPAHDRPVHPADRRVATPAAQAQGQRDP